MPEVHELRARQRRNLLTTLMLSQGVPMLLAGDEMGRTQRGNNNAYAQDNEISWVDWSAVDDDLLDFTRRLIELRRSNPVLQLRSFLSGTPADGAELPDVAWFTAEGTEMSSRDWDERTGFVSLWLNGDIHDVGPRGEAVTGSTLLLGFNLGASTTEWRLPEACWGRGWTRVLDTVVNGEPRNGVHAAGEVVDLAGRSIVVLRQEPTVARER